MTSSSLTTFSGRYAAILVILADYINMDDVIRTNSQSNEFNKPNGLDIFWAARSGQLLPGIGISKVDSWESAIAGVRHMVTVDRGPLDMTVVNDDAYELPGNQPDEYIAVLGYCSRVVVVVADCQVEILGLPADRALTDFIEPAIRIAREIGCTPYEDDITPPQLPEEWRSYGWTAYPPTP